MISSPSQLVGAPKGTEVTLECNVEAFPKSINYWVRESGKRYENSSLFLFIYLIRLRIFLSSTRFDYWVSCDASWEPKNKLRVVNRLEKAELIDCFGFWLNPRVVIRVKKGTNDPTECYRPLPRLLALLYERRSTRFRNKRKTFLLTFSLFFVTFSHTRRTTK